MIDFFFVHSLPEQYNSIVYGKPEWSPCCSTEFVGSRAMAGLAVAVPSPLIKHAYSYFRSVNFRFVILLIFHNRYHVIRA